MPFVEDADEFAARQGCESIQLDDGRSELFANGARYVVDLFGNLTARYEAPTERWESLRAKRLFLQIKLDRARNDFEYFSDQVGEQLQWAQRSPEMCPPPTEKNLATVAALRRAVRDLELEVAKIDQELLESPRAVAQRALERQRSEVQAGVAQMQQRFSQIMSGYNSPQPQPSEAELALKAQAQNTAAVAAMVDVVDQLNTPPVMGPAGGRKKK